MTFIISRTQHHLQRYSINLLSPASDVRLLLMTIRLIFIRRYPTSVSSRPTISHYPHENILSACVNHDRLWSMAIDKRQTTKLCLPGSYRNAYRVSYVRIRRTNQSLSTRRKEDGTVSFVCLQIHLCASQSPFTVGCELLSDLAG